MIFYFIIKQRPVNIILYCLFVFNFLSVSAQNWSQAVFEHFNVENGLSSSAIYCLHRDVHGFLWVGTDNGLNRYDGYNFHTFRNQLADATSISNNHIQSIFEDKEGILWIATWKFINSYNPKTGRFKVFPYPTDSVSELDCRTNFIEAWNNDTLMVSTNIGPALFCKKNGHYSFFRVKPKAKIAEQDYVFCSKRLFKNNILVATFDDLYLTNPYQNSAVKIDVKALKMHKYYSHVTGKITPYKPHEWLIETWNADLLIYNDQDQTLRNHFFDKPYSYLDYGTGAIATIKTKDGFVFGTNGKGMIITDNNLVEQIRLQNDKQFANSLSSNYVSCLLRDNEGIYWIGTDKGLNKFDPQKQQLKFQKYHFQSPYFNGPDNIYDVFVTKNNRIFMMGIWGAYSLDSINQKAKFLEILNTKKFRNFFGKPFYIKDSLICWPRLGGFQTFFMNENKNKFELNSLKEYQINNYLSTPNDVDFFNACYYALFNKEGLYKIDVVSGNAQHINLLDHNKQVLKAERFNVLEPVMNKPDCYYLGTAPRGLYEVNLRTFEVKKINIQLIPNFDILNVTHIAEHKNGNIWLGTEFHGVLFFNAAQNKWQELNQQALIGNNHIRNLFLVGDSLLCIMVSDAIYLLDLISQKVTKVGYQEGLGHESVPASFFLHHNTVYFAHESGILETKFDRLRPASVSNKAIFTEIFTGQTHTYLATNNSQVKLPYPENSIRISFAKLSFHNPAEHQFQYKFEGTNTDWIDLGNNHELVLHKLPYGSYKLFIKEIANAEEKLNEIAVLNITVEAPFYLQEWFILLAFLFIAGFIVLVYRILLLRKIAILKTRDTIARDLHDEVGSALTSISYLSEVGKIQRGDGTGTFDKIGETSRSITSLMNDIIWAINPDKDNAFSLIQRINFFIQEHQHDESLTIAFDYSNKLIHHAFSMSERKSLYLIFKEALNNAFKYANATKINIRLIKSGSTIVLEIEDNGKGFSSANHKGNGLQNMRKRAKDIGAEFEIISLTEKGTIIRVTLNHQNWVG